MTRACWGWKSLLWVHFFFFSLKYYFFDLIFFSASAQGMVRSSRLLVNGVPACPAYINAPRCHRAPSVHSLNFLSQATRSSLPGLDGRFLVVVFFHLSFLGSLIPLLHNSLLFI
ncbi:hypothetical protein P170DRAFT_168107 [Aspergillus steynii IBT 23096]|uniref:Uncharacterized protein n=1 Tax=Aspergillus steynii IBT 23096 TaxID=1392250 RepID=A0A2I2G7I5_9EURO|nr:uncharacterized protein P170DRAFT_168107 [Aspergillus steynii IBT 23096]PLB48834.1 hypothetical protein P170DRAFT_168107 [Aspergillus steynii IBT 23096]